MKKTIKRIATGLMAVLLLLCLWHGSGSMAKAASPSLSKKELSLQVGKSTVLKVSNGKGKTMWKSSKKSVATVSSKGRVKAKKAGTAVITAVNSKKKMTCKVTVYQKSAQAKSPDVYFTADITPDGLLKVYDALSWKPGKKLAVKVSTGEPPASNYLRPDLIGSLVQSLGGTIVECNTAYGGSRSSTAMHRQVAKDHGFTSFAEVDIMDEDGSLSIPVTGGTRLEEDLVGAHFADYDSFLILSHFKGHAMAGFGGAIKNISIGIGSSEGKVLIHTGGKRKNGSIWGGDQEAFLESMAEAGKAVSDYLGNGKDIVYINVMNRLSVDCDCDGNPAEPDMHDIGILASSDPVALDQACVDLVYAQKDGDGASLVKRIESLDGLHTLEHAERIGLGSREYRLVDVDD